METDETVFQILLHTNMDDLKLLCQANKRINKICHNPYFIKKKLTTLPTIHTPIDLTLFNLFHINRLTHLAYQLIDYFKTNPWAVLNYSQNNIKELAKVNPLATNKILSQVYKTQHDKTSKYFGEFEGRLIITYNQKYLKDQWVVTTNDNQFYISYWIYTPDDLEEVISLTENEMMAYLVNLFLHYKNIGIINGKLAKKFKTVNELEKWLK